MVQNTSDTSAVDEVGWNGGPNVRGTTDIVWSCISIVILCTWTVLHLNLPGLYDTEWNVYVRKAKWMAINVLFPEFVFARAVEELRMSTEDLYFIKRKIDFSDGGWTVKIGTVEKTLHRILCNGTNITRASDEQKQSNAEAGVMPAITQVQSPNKEVLAIEHLVNTYHRFQDGQDIEFECVQPVIPPNTHEKLTWTLSHCYLVNMGGLVSWQKGIKEPWECKPWNNHQLVTGCIGSSHDPLPKLRLSKKEIQDRSKADWATLSLAVWQISFLILSLVMRACGNMPITQLEIATVAFSVVGIATYAANWGKPKDIKKPIEVGAWPEYHSTCGERASPLVPLVSNTLKPTATPSHDLRIHNDSVRQPRTVFALMAICSLIFGGLHCLAWNSEFPTRVELWLWRTASICSAGIPLFALATSTALGQAARWKKLRDFKQVQASFIELTHISEEWWDDLQNTDFSRPVYREAVQRYYNLKNTESADEYLTQHFQEFYSLHKISYLPHSLIENAPVLENLRDLSHDSTEILSRISKLQRLGVEWKKFEIAVAESRGMGSQTCVKDGLLDYLIQRKEALERGRDIERENGFERASWMVPIGAAGIYMLARLSLLALCFSTLREQPVGVYGSTWARYLPSFL